MWLRLELRKRKSPPKPSPVVPVRPISQQRPSVHYLGHVGLPTDVDLGPRRPLLIQRLHGIKVCPRRDRNTCYRTSRFHTEEGFVMHGARQKEFLRDANQRKFLHTREGRRERERERLITTARDTMERLYPLTHRPEGHDSWQQQDG
jgi:hypothetical protein